MGKLILGLDIGPNSIGWALVNDGTDGPSKTSLVNLGVRVFPEGVENFDTGKEASRNEVRRLARHLRRKIRRSSRRREILKLALVASDLWPTDPRKEAALYNLDPYKLRATAINQRLEPYEIGRVLLHLNQRRGFLSIRKKDRHDKEVQGMLAEINALAEAMRGKNESTVGQHFAAALAAEPLTGIRGQHTRRSMFEDEFDTIWRRQSEYHPLLLTEQLKYGRVGKQPYPHKSIPTHDRRRNGATLLESFGIHGILFFQRPLFWPKSLIGNCELEPKQKRCLRADRHAQRFRMLHEVNKLRYSDPDAGGDEIALTDVHRKSVLDFLALHDKATFDQLKTILCLGKSARFNVERGERSSVAGMVVDRLMAKAVGKKWHSRAETEKDEIVRLLVDDERDDDAVTAKLLDVYKFVSKDIAAALDIDFPPGYARLSLKAIDKLLPYLERGLPYQAVDDPTQSAIHASGYLQCDPRQSRVLDELPDPSRIRSIGLSRSDLLNPVARRALIELRKVVNAIIREYGKPDAIHLEVARTIQLGKEKRSRANSENHKRESKRQVAAEFLRSLNIKVSREAVVRCLLWEEQLRECIYCGRSIAESQLFTNAVTVDHILPYPRCLDGSQTNKVVCHCACNHDKGRQTPYEWLSPRPEDYARLCKQIGSLFKDGQISYRKYRRFRQTELELDVFIGRQLTDIAYFATTTREYLRCLYDKDRRIVSVKGQLTAELRWQWGLDTILKELADSPAWQGSDNCLSLGKGNCADFRHHAINAVVIAMINRSRLSRLSNLTSLEKPWPTFREDVLEAIKRVYVSFRVERKVGGKLHEETFYGITDVPGEWTVRKPVTSLSPSEIERIRDPEIKRIVIDRLQSHGIDFGRGKKFNATTLQRALTSLHMPSGVPIKKVRVRKPELSIQYVRGGKPNQAFVKPGSTHHICIFELVENGHTIREAVFITLLEAVNRLKRKEPVIQRIHPQKPTARFIMSLARRELVWANWKGKERLLVFKTASSTQGQISFADHLDARRRSEQTKFVATANTLDAKKVTVDPIGRMRWAND